MEMRKEGKEQEDLHIFSIDLSITYSMYEQLVELKANTYEGTSPTISILDRDLDNNHAVTIELSDLDEINLIITDFKKKLKSITNGRN